MNAKDIMVCYGKRPKEMVLQLLEQIRPEEGIDKNSKVGIKPNLVVAKPYTSGATTCPEIVEGIISYFKDKGYDNLVILEGSWVGARTSRAFSACGYTQLEDEYNVPLVDLQKDSHRSYTVDNMSISVCDEAMNLDYLINVPVLKGHCQTSLTCALKNLKGCIPNSEKRRFHTMGLHKPIAHLNKILKADLIIVDGIMGDLDFEEGGNPVEMNRIIAGKDPVLVDAYGALQLGYDIDEIEYIEIANKIGVGSSNIDSANIIEFNKDNKMKVKKSTRRAQHLAKYIDEKDACSACYGSLIYALHRLDERGMLRRLKGKISIGQGYKGKSGDGIGIGACTKGLSDNIMGCPPSANEIVRRLEEIIRNS